MFYHGVQKMADVQLEDRIPFYPSQDEEYFQTLASGYKEFADLPSLSNETVPARAKGFNHQELVKRFMLAYDRLYAFHKTGTGKSLTGILSDELSMKRTAADLSDLLMSDIHTSIKKTLILVKGDILAQQFVKEIVCKGTPKGTYETKEVLESDTNTMQTSRINRLIKEKYEITQYGKFANYLEKLSDHEIEENYSDTFIILDEIQSLRNALKDMNKASRTRAEQGYANKRGQLVRLIKFAKRTKVLILSATPMINDPKELSLIMNLLYPNAEERMLIPNTFDSDDWTLATLEPFLRGRVSAVRELDTGVTTKYMGVPIEGTFETLDAVEMSDLQREVYDSLPDHGAKTNFWTEHREALTFVYPNGKFTEKDGFNVYINKRGGGGDNYVANQELLSYIANRTGPRNLSDLSPGYQQTIDICKNNPTKNCFIYTEYVKGPGAIVLSLCFDAQGYSKFTTQNSVFVQDKKSKVKPFCESEDISDLPVRPEFKLGKRRYALLTRETPKSLAENILTVFNSYQNRHGDLIQVLIGSRKTREGLNLSNVMIGNMMNGFWTVPHGYQAESRMKRATSQVHLVNERQDEIIGYAGVQTDEPTAHQQILELHSYYVALMRNQDPEYLEEYENMIGAYSQMEHIYRTANVGSERLINTNELIKIFRQAKDLSEPEDYQIKQIGDQAKATYKIRKYISDHHLEEDEQAAKVLELTGSLRVGANLITRWLFQNQDRLGPKTFDQIRLALTNGSFKTSGSRLADRNRMRETIKSAYRTIIVTIKAYIERLEGVPQPELVIEYLQAMNQILLQYRDPDDATVEIEVYKHVTVYNSNQPLPPGKDQFDTFDVTIYRYAEDSDRVVRRIERIVKQIAFDGQIHKKRNMITDRSKDYTPACDYEPCYYDTVDPVPLTIYIFADRWLKLYDRALEGPDGVKIFDGLKWLPLDISEYTVHRGALLDHPTANLNDLLLADGVDAIDRSNYDILYSHDEVDAIVQKILSIFASRNRATYDQIFGSMPEQPQRYVLEAIIKIIDNKIPVYNRFGVVNYMNADNDTIFINPDYPRNPFYTENILGLGYYSQNLHGVASMSLTEINNTVRLTPPDEIYQQFTGRPVDQSFYDDLEKLDSVTRATLLEKSIDLMLEGNQTPQNIAILERFNNHYYFVRAPEYALNEIRRLKMEKLSGRGRNPKPGGTVNIEKKNFINDDYIEYAKRNNVQYIMGSLIHENIPYVNYGTIENGVVSEIFPETSDRILVLHIANVITENDRSSGIVPRLLKASSDLRVREQVGDTVWRDVRSDEIEIYSTILRLEINRRFVPFRDLPYYGLITLGNVLRIIRGAGENIQDTSTSKQLCTSVVGGSPTKVAIMLELDPDLEKYPDIFFNIPPNLDDILRIYIDIEGMSEKEKIINWIIRRDNSDTMYCNYIRRIFYQKSIDEGRPYIIQF